MPKPTMTIREAQKECTRLRALGDPKSLKRAQKLENSFRDHPDYEDDHAWLTRMQAGAHRH